MAFDTGGSVTAAIELVPALRWPRRLRAVRIAAGRRPELQNDVIMQDFGADVHPHVPQELLLQRLVLLQAALRSQTDQIGD